MDTAQNPSNSECHTPPSEPFRFQDDWHIEILDSDSSNSFELNYMTWTVVLNIVWVSHCDVCDEFCLLRLMSCSPVKIILPCGGMCYFYLQGKECVRHEKIVITSSHKNYNSLRVCIDTAACYPEDTTFYKLPLSTFCYYLFYLRFV
jgi:hypothetical protein